MKLIVKSIILATLCLANATAFADCSSSKNSDIDITKPDSIYTDNGDGTVSVTNTGLIWQQCALGLSGSDCTTGTSIYLNWQQALAAATDSTSAGYTDWRLPNQKELFSLIDTACINPAINVTFFPIGGERIFWSSSAGSYWAYSVNFGSGEFGSDYKNASKFVRLVRTGK